jgi:hypothetical protein
MERFRRVEREDCNATKKHRFNGVPPNETVMKSGPKYCLCMRLDVGFTVVYQTEKLMIVSVPAKLRDVVFLSFDGRIDRRTGYDNPNPFVLKRLKA